VQESATAQANSSPGEVRGAREEVVHGLGQARGAPEKPHAATHRRSKVCKMESVFHYNLIGTNHIEFRSPNANLARVHLPPMAPPLAVRVTIGQCIPVVHHRTNDLY
jgi:hypothetical protein